MRKQTAVGRVRWYWAFKWREETATTTEEDGRDGWVRWVYIWGLGTWIQFSIFFLLFVGE